MKIVMSSGQSLMCPWRGLTWPKPWSCRLHYLQSEVRDQFMETLWCPWGSIQPGKHSGKEAGAEGKRVRLQSMHTAKFLWSTPNKLSGRYHSTLSWGFSTGDTKSSRPTKLPLSLHDESKTDFKCKVQFRPVRMHEAPTLKKLHLCHSIISTSIKPSVCLTFLAAVSHHTHKHKGNGVPYILFKKFLTFLDTSN